MDIKTKDGISITVLPDCARCTIAKKNPLFMTSCPCYNFDDFGDICVPELCDHYTEDWNK